MNFNKMKKVIYWDVLVLMLLGTLGLNPNLFFVISVGYYLWLILKNRGRICIPKVPGIGIYIIFILYGTVVGIMLYSFRNVLRDLSYILPTVLWIFISYHMARRNQNKEKSILATLYLYGGLVAVKCMISFLINPTSDFEKFRDVFGQGVYGIGFIVPIMIVEVFIYGKTIFSKILDRVIIVVMVVQIALSFGRIALLQPIIELFIIMFLVSKQRLKQSKIVSRVAFLLGIFVVVGVGVFYIVPDSITTAFSDKVVTTLTEIDSSQAIASVGEAMNNWRAYEIQATQEQWRSSNILVRFLGAGIGKGIQIKYIPHTWNGLISNNEIPLLHNGFYTLLPKGGVFAVFALCMLFIGSVYKGYKVIKSNRSHGNGEIILVAVSVAALANTYVVSGPVQQGTFLIWAIIVGWMNFNIERKEIGCNDYI